MTTMKVKICGVCPYTPQDLDRNYDPNAMTYCCVRCPSNGLLHTATGPYFREDVSQIKRTNFYKRGGLGHATG